MKGWWILNSIGKFGCNNLWFENIFYNVVFFVRNNIVSWIFILIYYETTIFISSCDRSNDHCYCVIQYPCFDSNKWLAHMVSIQLSNRISCDRSFESFSWSNSCSKSCLDKLTFCHIGFLVFCWLANCYCIRNSFYCWTDARYYFF